MRHETGGQSYNEIGALIGADELHAYVDGRLDADRRSAISHDILAHPDTAMRVNAYIEQRNMLRAALAGPAAEAIPIRLNLLWIIHQRLTRQR